MALETLIPQKFAIFAPVGGIAENVPSILLQKAFMPENENVRVHHGKVMGAKLRLDEMVEVVFDDGTLSMTEGDATVTPSGGGGTFGTTATHKPAWGSADLAAATGRAITIYGHDPVTDAATTYNYTIVSIADDGSSLELNAVYAGKTEALLVYEIGTAFEKVPVPDENPILHIDRLEKGAPPTEYLFAFTKKHVYLWSAPWSAWMLKWTCGSDCTLWDSISFNDKMIATNGVDYVIDWGDTINNEFSELDEDNAGATNKGLEYATTYTTGSTVDADSASGQKVLNVAATGNFSADGRVIINRDGAREEVGYINTIQDGVSITLKANLTYTHTGVQADVVENSTGAFVTKAKYLTRFQNYLVVGYTTEEGVTYPNNIRCCDWAQDEVWNKGDADYFPIEGHGILSGFGKHENLLVIGKEDCIKAAYLVESSEVFKIITLLPHIGTKSPHSFVNDRNGMLYFFATDFSFRNILGQEISQLIDSTVKNITPSLVGGIESTFIKEYGKIWWSVPHGNTATENNKVIKWDGETFCFDGIAVSAFGTYARASSYTIDTIPFDSIDTIAWETIDSVEMIAGFMPDLGGDYSGYMYALHANELDSGSSYTRKFQLSTDLADKTALPYFKRLSYMWFWVEKRGNGTLSIEIKQDKESSWQTVGSVSLDGDTDVLVQGLDCDYLARHYTLQISSTNPFSLIGVVFESTLMGDR